MPELQTIELRPPKILVYGKPGSGKTVWALSGGQITQVMDLDLGVRSGMNVKDEFTEMRKRVDVIQYCETQPQRAEAFLAAKFKALAVSEQCGLGKYGFQILVVDSLSSLAEYALRYVMQNSGGIDKPKQIQHWGMAISEIEGFLMILRSLPIPVILLAHDQRDKIDGADIIELGIYGKNLPANIMKYFDEIFYSRAVSLPGGVTGYSFQTKSDAVRTARSRTNLPDPFNPMKTGVLELLKMMGWSPRVIPQTPPPTNQADKPKEK